MRFKDKRQTKTAQSTHLNQSGILRDSSIKWKMVLETIQYPLILIALLVFIISIFYLIFLSRMFGGGWEALAFVLISGLGAAGSYLHHYQKEYPVKVREIMERIELEMKQSDEAELKQLAETLRAGLVSLVSAEGLKSLAQLISEYEQLKESLGQRRSTDPLSISIIPGLAEETFRRGLSVLSDALELMKVMQKPGRNRLEKEITSLKKEIHLLEELPDQGEVVAIKKRSLAMREERMSLLNKIQLNVEQLLYQAQRCDSALHNARVELLAVRIVGNQNSVDAVIESLQERIIQAKEVQEELKKIGF